MNLNVKKRELRNEIFSLVEENGALKRQLSLLKSELDAIRTDWRPVPIMHEWEPRNPQCVLCDDSRDAPRHQVDTVRRAERG